MISACVVSPAAEKMNCWCGYLLLSIPDPGLADAVRSAVLDSGLAAGDAILQATAHYADAIAALEDEMLRQRADDVRAFVRKNTGGESEREALPIVVRIRRRTRHVELSRRGERLGLSASNHRQSCKEKQASRAG